MSTTMLTDAQAKQIYGVDLSSVGLQAIWLRMENRNDHSYWLMVSALDPNYFAPGEAAALFQAQFLGQPDEQISQRFRELAMPLKSPANSITEGYVLAPRHEGGRYIAVTLAGEERALHFDFAVTVPDGDFDFESLDPAQIYAGRDLPNLSLEQLREHVRELNCCTLDSSGKREGDPLNLVLLGNAGDMLAALSRSGWSFTHRIDAATVRRLIGAGISGGAYPVAPVSPLYLFGRSQDLALQRARNTIFQRNHIRLWLAPFHFEGQSVWVGQVSRDVSIKPTLLSTTLVTHVIDPNVDESREHLLQSLMVSGVMQRFAFAGGGAAASHHQPRHNLTADPYFSDGLRLVAQISGQSTTALDEIEFLDWKDSVDPARQSQQRHCDTLADGSCEDRLPAGARPAGLDMGDGLSSHESAAR